MDSHMNRYQPSLRIKALTAAANSLVLDFAHPISRYIRSGKELLRMADCYYKEKRYENAYILYMKYLTLFVEKIRSHPGYKALTVQEKQTLDKECKNVFPLAELVKKKLIEKYSLEFDIELKRYEEEERRKIEEEKRCATAISVSDVHLEEKPDTQLVTNFKAFTVSDPRAGYPTDNTSAMVKLRNFIPEMDNAFLQPRPVSPSNISSPPVDLTSLRIIPKPTFGPKPSAPPIESPKQEAPQSTRRLMPSVDRSTKPSYLALMSPLLSDEMRMISLPRDICATFLARAFENTTRNVETCGILGGKFQNLVLTVTHLIIPKQTGTADSCLTEREEQVFDYQDRYGLMTLGWIHTHPTQTAFLSSIDLHTHAAYQMMLPEAIAIVCAPKFNENKVFNLTLDHGIGVISKCRETGFHPHPKHPPLFEVTCSPLRLNSNNF